MGKEQTKPSNPSVYPDPMRGAPSGHDNQNPWQHPEGITLRDKFANSAMQSILNHKHYDGQQLHELNENRFLNVHWDQEVTEKDREQALKCVLDDAGFVAKRAYIMADAMLKQREL